MERFEQKRIISTILRIFGEAIDGYACCFGDRTLTRVVDLVRNSFRDGCDVTVQTGADLAQT
jgi:hypothetical protein